MSETLREGLARLCESLEKQFAQEGIDPERADVTDTFAGGVMDVVDSVRGFLDSGDHAAPDEMALAKARHEGRLEAQRILESLVQDYLVANDLIGVAAGIEGDFDQWVSQFDQCCCVGVVHFDDCPMWTMPA